MAVYKVPQDVEADDKLIGPFSFRQFVYLVIVVLCIALAWGLWQLFIPLSIIPLPGILFFGALALPLRKDQPMEIYMAAIVSFYLKPHRRTWDPDGIESLIEITVPKTLAPQLTKDFSQSEAERRLTYLARIVDTRGWAVRGVGVEAPNTALNSDVYFEAQQADDLLDDSSSTAQALTDRLNRSNEMHHQNLVKMVSQPQATQSVGPPADVPAPAAMPDEPNIHLEVNPYPDEMRQKVILPESEQKPAKPVKESPKTTSSKGPSPDIINLINESKGLNVATISRMANRINDKKDMDEEVVISLR